MRRPKIRMLALLLPLAVAGCGGASTGTADVNLKEVLDRTVKTLVARLVKKGCLDFEVDGQLFCFFQSTKILY